MIQLAVVAAVAAVIGGVVAITVRDSRLVALGLFLAMVTAPLASSPEPTQLAIAFRLLGASLAAYLLWAAARGQSIASEGSGIGVVAEVAAAAAAFSAGWVLAPVKPLAGPLAAQAAGISLLVVAIGPLTGRNVLRVGTSVAVLTLGISLLLEAWIGPASSLQQIALMALLVGIVGATSLLMSPIEPPITRPLAEAGAPGGVGLHEAADESAAEAVGAGPVDRPGASPRTVTGAAPADERTQAPSEPSSQAAPVPGRTRRLHPREPRR